MKVSLKHKETSKMKKKRLLCATQLEWKIGVEILMYIQISILVKAAFFSEEIQQSILIINQKNKMIYDFLEQLF